MAQGAQREKLEQRGGLEYQRKGERWSRTAAVEGKYIASCGKRVLRRMKQGETRKKKKNHFRKIKGKFTTTSRSGK